MGSTAKRAGLKGYEEVGEGVDVFLGPSSIAKVLEVACFGVCHLHPGEVNVLNDVLEALTAEMEHRETRSPTLERPYVSLASVRWLFRVSRHPSRVK